MDTTGVHLVGYARARPTPPTECGIVTAVRATLRAMTMPGDARYVKTTAYPGGHTGTDRPLGAETVAALFFALGKLSQIAPSKRHPGLMARVADELAARGELAALLAAMGEAVREALATLIEMDRSAGRRNRKVRVTFHPR